ncbi:MAG: ABC transporter ATP-binding protein/permease [Treponema sp.]|jgi:ABC-type multidrug transport system fused ATPase/permease subunit|nr:ABC transporter ATP-binding protein/permease [Treponema sp.]
MNPVIKLFSLLTKRERLQLIPFCIGILLTAGLEIVEIGSLGPFMAVIVDPDIIQRQPLLFRIYSAAGFQSTQSFLVFLGCTVFALVFSVTVLKMAVTYISCRFVANCNHSLGVRLFQQYLYQPYQFFLYNNTGELSKNLLAEVGAVISGVLRPSADILVRGILTAGILVFLTIIQPIIAVLALAIFGILYVVLYGSIRSRLNRYGRKVREANFSRYKIVAEAFGGIKDVKILGKEYFFSHFFNSGEKEYVGAQMASQILSSLPSQIMQSLAIGFALVLLIMSLITQGSLTQILPLVAVYAFAIMRLSPNIQIGFQDLANIRYNTHTVDALYEHLTGLPPPDISDVQTMYNAPDVLLFTQCIEISDVGFSYPSSGKPVLREINLRINKNSTVGFVGSTGCGKTTLVDIIIGLMEPDTGAILADGNPVVFSSVGNGVRRNVAPWQRNFGYVPQQIYLTDDTIAANIAFGIPQDIRDKNAIEQAARTANLHTFVAAELPDGYDTMIGEKGIRLSGGQRQRIGIARALYHDPSILIMDEATSALDSVTEEAVMDAIHNLTHSKTIIIIAHRLSTVRECDTICLMEKGQIMARGTYDELIDGNAHFRAMAKVKR